MRLGTRIAALTVALGVVLGTAACSAGSTGTGKSSGPLRVMLPSDPDTTELLKSLPAFEKRTGIKVQVTQVPQDQVEQRLRVATSGGGSSTFDVAGFQYELIPTFAQDLLPVNKYLTSADRSDIIPSMLKATTYQNNVYGQLYVATVELLFYRKDLLNAAGISVPTTWSQYLTASKSLTKGNVFGTMVTAKNNEEPVGMYLNYLYQNGGDVVDSAGNVTIDSPKAVQALQFMVDLVHKYKVAPPDAANLWTADTTTLFTSKKLATAPNWSYMWGAATASTSPVKSDVAVAPLPCNVRCGASLGGWTLSAFKNTAQAANAYKFIHFMTDTQRQVKMAVEGGNTPTRLSAANNTQVSGIPVYKVETTALKTAVPRTEYKNYPAIGAALATAISAAVGQTESPQQALQTAAQQIKSSLG